MVCREPYARFQKEGSMSKDDEVCLELGREMVRMIHEVRNVAHGDAGYARRTFSFPGGAVILLLANTSELADLMEEPVRRKYRVKTVTPPSQTS